MQPGTTQNQPGTPGTSHSDNVRRRSRGARQSAAGAKLKGYFAAKAKERMLEGRNQHSSPPVNLPEGRPGDARDQAAAKVGVSGKRRSYTSSSNILGVMR
jgi:hypothetical protein